MRNIGIFGGSFDPVHSGHLRVALNAIRDVPLDVLHIVPASVSPFKTDATRGKFGYDRLALLEKVFAGIPRAVVDMREIDRGGVSYTIDTVRSIAFENPGDRIFLVVGQDSMDTLPGWRSYGELEKMCSFVPYPRTPESSTEIRRRLAAGESVAGLVPEGFEKEYAP